jgi:hypothetical protein
MIQPLRLWTRNIGRVCSSCPICSSYPVRSSYLVRSLLPVVQQREASSHYWAKSNSTHIKQARRKKAKRMTAPFARHSQFQDAAEFEEAMSILRRYLLTGFRKGVFSVQVDPALSLLSWMMDMGDKINHEKFATMCEGMSSLDVVDHLLTLNRTLSRCRPGHGVCTCPTTN